MRIVFHRGCVTELIIFMAIATLVGYGIRSELLRQRAVSDRIRVWAQLAQLHSALHTYAGNHGELPPLATVPEDSGEGLSWRVLILPDLGEKELFEQFDFTKSWDAPANLALLPQMPRIFARSYEQSRAGKTYCCAVHFEGSWNGGNRIDLAAESASALLLAESQVSREWTRPLDIELAPGGQTVHTVRFHDMINRPPIGKTRNGQRVDLKPGVEWYSLRNAAKGEE